MPSNDEYLACRTYGHAWDDFDDVTWPIPAGADSITLRCTRCFSVRRFIIDRYGEVIARRYRYARGYQYARADDRPTKAQFRLWYIQGRRGSLSAVGSARKRTAPKPRQANVTSLQDHVAKAARKAVASR